MFGERIFFFKRQKFIPVFQNQYQNHKLLNVPNSFTTTKQIKPLLCTLVSIVLWLLVSKWWTLQILYLNIIPLHPYLSTQYQINELFFSITLLYSLSKGRKASECIENQTVIKPPTSLISLRIPAQFYLFDFLLLHREKKTRYNGHLDWTLYVHTRYQ